MLQVKQSPFKLTEEGNAKKSFSKRPEPTFDPENKENGDPAAFLGHSEDQPRPRLTSSDQTCSSVFRMISSPGSTTSPYLFSPSSKDCRTESQEYENVLKLMMSPPPGPSYIKSPSGQYSHFLKPSKSVENSPRTREALLTSPLSSTRCFIAASPHTPTTRITTLRTDGIPVGSPSNSDVTAAAQNSNCEAQLPLTKIKERESAVSIEEQRVSSTMQNSSSQSVIQSPKSLHVRPEPKPEPKLSQLKFVEPSKSGPANRRALPLLNVEEKPHLDVIEESIESDGEGGHASDGYDIGEFDQLDNNSDLLSPTGSTSPFIKSFLTNKMVQPLDDEVVKKLQSAKEGSSPALPSNDFPGVKLSGTDTLKLRRCASMLEPLNFRRSPDNFKPISTILDFTSPVSRCSFKRPVPPPTDEEDSLGSPSKKPKLKTVKPRACHFKDNKLACSIADKPNLTADGSRQLLLPTVLGTTSNRDLNNIDSHAVASLISGKYADQVASYRIIDARYKYEFEGGHIRGAENFGRWNEQAFFDEFFPSTLGPKEIDESTKTDESFSAKRHILIFHCEFSSERGPCLIRLLRKRDRKLNEDSYPALHYPEVYLLHEGYKAFFALYPLLCDPQSYIPMAHPNYVKEERKFHSRNRTWQAGGSVARTGHIVLRDRTRSDMRDTAGSPCMGKKSLFR